MSRKIKVINTILIKDPQPNTLASYILLKQEYKRLDDDMLETRTYLGMRFRFLRKSLYRKGILKCEYCGKSHLDLGLDDLESVSNNKENSRNKNLATIDHFFAVKDNKDLYLDTRNWVVSCRSCNTKKSHRNPFKWLRQSRILFNISDELNELINSSKYLLRIKNHPKTGYRHPDEYTHIEKMKIMYKKAV